MIKPSLLLCFLLGGTLLANSQSTTWKPAGDRIKTLWTDSVKPANVLPEYPRPQLVRSGNWTNLNGLWQYAFFQNHQVTISRRLSGANTGAFCRGVCTFRRWQNGWKGQCALV